jgi:hypothetical protein
MNGRGSGEVPVHGPIASPQASTDPPHDAVIAEAVAVTADAVIERATDRADAAQTDRRRRQR